MFCCDSRCAWLQVGLTAPLHGFTQKARQDCVLVSRSSWEKHASSPCKVQYVQQGWCMSMEMAGHFDGEKAKLQSAHLPPELSSMHDGQVLELESNRWSQVSDMELRPGLHLSG